MARQPYSSWEAELNDYPHESVRVFVDTSIFVGNSAFGRASGYINLPIFPQIGDSISFAFTSNSENSIESDFCPLLLTVEGRILSANCGINDIMTSLSPITSSDANGAKLIMSMLENNWGLFGEYY